jgi:DNA polymerase III subunit chi
MPSVAFHFNAPAKLPYACRLLRKAVGAGSTVAVLGDETMLAKLDEQLWSFSALDFVPHGRFVAMTETQRRVTPIWLVDMPQQGQGRDVLVNLTPAVPDDLDAFSRVIEVVTLDAADRNSARMRWKQYTERGFEIVRHDLQLQA